MNFKKRFFLLLTVLTIIVLMMGISVFLSSCDDVRAVIGIKINGGELNTYNLGAFNYSDYTVTVLYDDGNSREIPLSSEMLSATEKVKFYSEGEQEIKVVYSNMEYIIKVKFLRNHFEGISLPQLSFTYDGTPHGLTIEGVLPSTAEVIFTSGNEFVNVGTYDVTCDILCDGYEKLTLSSHIIINKADYDLSALSWIGGTDYVYNGKEYKVELAGLPQGVTVDYIDNKKTDAGNYVASVICYYDAANYNKPVIPSYTWSIAQGEYDMSKVFFEDLTCEYDGKEHTLTLAENSILPTGVTVSYFNNAKTNAGIYTARAIFTGDALNYKAITPLERVLTITKKVISLGDFEYDDQVFTYDGTPHYTPINPINYSSDFTVEYIITQNGEVVENAINAGTYEVEARFTYLKGTIEHDNYLADTSLFAEITIEKATIPRNTFSFDNTKFVYNGEDQKVKLSNGSISFVPSFGGQKDKDGMDIPFFSGVVYKYFSGTGEVTETINVGEYTVTATVSVSDVYQSNFNIPTGIVSSYRIYKKSMTEYLTEHNNPINVTYEDNIIYDGTEKTLTLSQLPAGILAKCNINDITVQPTIEGGNVYKLGRDAGDYKYSISFTFDDSLSNYDNDITLLSGVINIAKQPIAINQNTLNGIDYFGNSDTTENAISIGSFYYGGYQYKKVEYLANYTATLKINGKTITPTKETDSATSPLLFPIGINVGIYKCDFSIHLDNNHTDYEFTRYYEIEKGDFDLADFITYDDGTTTQRYIRIDDGDILDYVTLVVEINGNVVTRSNNSYLIGSNAGDYEITYTVGKTNLGENNINNIIATSYTYTIVKAKVEDYVTVYSENAAYQESDGKILVRGVPTGVSVYYKLNNGASNMASVVGGEATITVPSKSLAVSTSISYEISFGFSDNVRENYSDTDKTYTGSIIVCQMVDPSDSTKFSFTYLENVNYNSSTYPKVLLVTTSYPFTNSDLVYWCFDIKTEGGNTTFKRTLSFSGDVVTILFGKEGSNAINFYSSTGYSFVKYTLKYNVKTGECTWIK